jgi:DNA polymerase-3 subunit alpha (Gram-positive type)
MNQEYMERVELNCHSRYSRMDGISPVRAVVDHAKENFMRAVALTDRSTVAGWGELCDRCGTDGEIKPIYGVEVCVADDALFAELFKTQQEDIYAEKIKAQEPSWTTILVQKESGRQALFRLLTEAEMKYRGSDGIVRIPWSELEEQRDGLLIGSGGIEGGLYRRLLAHEDPEFIADFAKRYDYIEVSPVSAKLQLLGGGCAGIRSESDIEALDRQLISLAGELQKPVVAVSGAYYLMEDDSEIRAILRNEAGAPDDGDADLHFHSTEEMLDAFSYLGSEEAWKIVVENPNALADSIETFPLERKERLWPETDDADFLLLAICERRLMELYGDEIDDEVWDRLSWEQGCLMETGSACVVLLVMELVRESGLSPNEIGYRGFLGNSLVAYLCGISCVNPLEARPPLEPEFAFGADGEKVLDIELNVPTGAYGTIRDLCGSLDGVSAAYMAGRPQTLSPLEADRAIGDYECRYGLLFEAERRHEIASALCQTIRSTNHAHPGDVLLVPDDCDITDFTPVVVDEDGKSRITDLPRQTLGFLYKMDIFASDSLDMVSELMEKTGVDVEDISLDDPDVMRMFRERKAIGVPEFNNPRIWEILETMQPTCFADLVRAVGMELATGAWEQNAQFLIKEGIVGKDEAIGTRDDIFDYILSLGLDREFAYQVAESVRKGRVFSGKDKRWKKNRTILRTAGAGEWFLWSCERIRYVFPRGHIYRSVLDAWWCAWFKLHFPQEFYSAYFAHCNKPKLVKAVEKGADAFELYVDGHDDAVAAQEEESGTCIHEDSLEIEVAREMFAGGYHLPTLS